MKRKLMAIEFLSFIVGIFRKITMQNQNIEKLIMELVKTNLLIIINLFVEKVNVARACGAFVW